MRTAKKSSPPQRQPCVNLAHPRGLDAIHDAIDLLVATLTHGRRRGEGDGVRETLRERDSCFSRLSQGRNFDACHEGGFTASAVVVLLFLVFIVRSFRNSPHKTPTHSALTEYMTHISAVSPGRPIVGYLSQSSLERPDRLRHRRYEARRRRDASHSLRGPSLCHLAASWCLAAFA